MDWNGKPYHALDYEMRRRFGTKVYKIALDGGMTCPNRDGTLGTGGCIFCSAGGSGDFAAGPGRRCKNPEDIAAEAVLNRQITEAVSRISRKMGKNPGAYIAYFQSYTNTYAPVGYLRRLFAAAVSHPQVRALSIATRPDCLPEEVIGLCAELNAIKPVWIELGLQTIHEDTAALIRRGYRLDCFTDTLARLRRRGLETIVHVILGLPGESREDMLATVAWLGRQDIQGIKLQLLHVLEGTDLAGLYRQGLVPVMSMEEYLDLVVDCVSLLPPEMVIHRLTGDGPKNLLLAPGWSTDKRLVLGSLAVRFRQRGIVQGCAAESVPAAASPTTVPSSR